ncbi:hypothetical protein DY000_02002038, partial [Brassica cretica]
TMELILTRKQEEEDRRFTFVANLPRLLWRRFCSEITTEIGLLAENWKYLLAGLILQYIHGLAAKGVHYIHRPGPTLQDLGFFLLPELGQERSYISETVFTSVFLSFFLACQFLRVITFYSTQLPGPNYHCREGSKVARLPWTKSLLEVLEINPHGVMYGCGDLIFSSHMIFTLVFVLTYHKYGTKRFIKLFGWLTAFVQSLLIIASRKHYTACQFLRVITFYSTQLPGPNYHCREGSKVARLPWTKSLLEVLEINPHGVMYGCGDLIFSSHMIFTLVFVLTYHKYGTKRFIKLFGWLTAFVQSLLIIASRKHYTVDVVVAWYTVNLVVFCLDKKLPELPDRTTVLLPVVSKVRMKEENHKLLLNGNGVDPAADWRPRAQVNGKIDSNGVHTDNSLNGA